MRPTRRAAFIRSAIVLAFIARFVLTASPRAWAQDNFDGAVWRFEMSSKTGPARKVQGRYRVSDHVLFQNDTPADTKFSKRVGTNHPNGGKTRFEVEDFRVFPAGQRPRRDNFVLMKGTARLKAVKFGEWEGLFTDGAGRNWDFKAFRILE